MENKRIKDLKKCKKMGIILLCIFNIVFPLVFIGVVEITMAPVSDIKLSNGFFSVEPMKIYHLIAYAMILSSIYLSFFVLYFLDKIFTEFYNEHKIVAYKRKHL